MISESSYTLYSPTYFWIDRFFRGAHLDNECPLGLNWFSLCCLVRGRLVIDAGGRSICAKAGDVIYFPRRRRYTSHWFGDPDVEFIAFYLSFQHHSISPHGACSLAQQPPQPDSYYFQVLPDDGSDQPAFFNRLLDLYHTPGQELAALASALSYYGQARSVMTREALPPMLDSVELALNYIESHCSDNFSIADVARQCGMSESRLYHSFREATGCSPIEYKNRERIRQAIELLAGGALSIEQISDQLNFSSPAYFRRIFKKYAGGQPSDYRGVTTRL